MYQRDRRLCVTCGGPAALCATSDRCVGLGQPGVRPPRLDDERRTRTAATVTSFGWRAKAALTAAYWRGGAFLASRFGPAGRPMLVFVGVPYAAVGVAVTAVMWRAHRTGG